MKSMLSKTALVAIVMVVALTPVHAQEITPDPSQLKVLNPDEAVRNLPSHIAAAAAAAAAASDPAALVVPNLKIFQYSNVSTRDGNTYNGSIVGGNPYNNGARTTTVPVVIIPLRIQFTGTVRNFDPTSPDDGCLGVGNTALSLTQASPVFQVVPNFTMNGVNLGNVTYADAFQRASFWAQVSTKTPAYHLGFNVSLAAKQTISVANDGVHGATFILPTCSTNLVASDNPPRLGVIDINTLDTQLNTIITNLGINHSQFPLFVIYGVVMSDGNATTGPCCILGYHNGSGNIADPGQTYGIAEYDNGAFFGAGVKDISVLSHEVSEWINDPSINNLVPPWGGLGQTTGCQDNLETGDPLSGTLAPAILMPNNVTYHPQEQAFFGWFLGTPAGAGGKYSSNGTFAGAAKACPPGGTNNYGWFQGHASRRVALSLFQRNVSRGVPER